MKGFPLILAVILSVWWHFIVFSFFTLKPISKDVLLKYYPKVTFLGTVIGQAGQTLQIGNVSDEGQTPDDMPEVDLPKRAQALDAIKGLAEKGVNLFRNTGKKMDYPEISKPDYVLNDEKIGEKIYSRDYLKDRRGDWDTVDNSAIFKIEHNIVYPEWARQRGIESELKILFRVNSAGLVDLVTIERFSGYPQLDLLGVHEVEQWRFDPESSPMAREQWGSVVVKFILD